MCCCGHHFEQALICCKCQKSSHQCAFLMPASVQVFTNESKSKLSARYKDKTVTNFACAVEQISGDSEKLHSKCSAEHGEITDIPAVGIMSSSSGDHEDCRYVDHKTTHLEDPDEDTELKKSKQNVQSSDQSHNLKSSIDYLEEAMSTISIPRASGETDSSVLAGSKIKRLSEGNVSTCKEGKLLVAKSKNYSPGGVKAVGVCNKSGQETLIGKLTEQSSCSVVIWENQSPVTNKKHNMTVLEDLRPSKKLKHVDEDTIMSKSVRKSDSSHFAASEKHDETAGGKKSVIPMKVEIPSAYELEAYSTVVHITESETSLPLALDAAPDSAIFGSSSAVGRVSFKNKAELAEYDNKNSPGIRPCGESLSGGTDATFAHDALEGMLQTLSRTKDSIGRATRIAFDCAKYGIADEVVELLIRQLETEASFHRRIDLFFLVDSITQCSHSQRGIAGELYIPIVQSALPRLLGAAAPPGASAHENRRQCLKAMRLWLERKIMPESVLRRYMDDINLLNEEASAGFFLRRPTRVDRSVDDPRRQMEDKLVDEDGSSGMYTQTLEHTQKHVESSANSLGNSTQICVMARPKSANTMGHPNERSAGCKDSGDAFSTSHEVRDYQKRKIANLKSSDHDDMKESFTTKRMRFMNSRFEQDVLSHRVTSTKAAATSTPTSSGEGYFQKKSEASVLLSEGPEENDSTDLVPAKGVLTIRKSSVTSLERIIATELAIPTKGTTILAVLCVDGWSLAGDTLSTTSDGRPVQKLKVLKAEERYVTMPAGHSFLFEILLFEVRHHLDHNQEEMSYARLVHEIKDRIIEKVHAFIDYFDHRLENESLSGSVVLIDSNKEELLVLVVDKDPTASTYRLVASIQNRICFGIDAVRTLFNKIPETCTMEDVRIDMIEIMETANNEDPRTGGMLTIFNGGPNEPWRCVHAQDFKGIPSISIVNQRSEVTLEVPDIGLNVNFNEPGREKAPIYIFRLGGPRFLFGLLWKQWIILGIGNQKELQIQIFTELHITTFCGAIHPSSEEPMILKI